MFKIQFKPCSKLTSKQKRTVQKVFKKEVKPVLDEAYWDLLRTGEATIQAVEGVEKAG